MSESWYYVLKGNRQGPVGKAAIESMISREELGGQDYVWKKGFENWKKIAEVDELQKSAPAAFTPPPVQEVPPAPSLKFASLKDLSADDRCIFVRIGNDRGAAATDYGPFTVTQLKQLFKERRINGKSMIFVSGMKEWTILADLPEYQVIFEEAPPQIKDSERRTTVRKPFIARLFIQANRQVFEGICRDISVGGMQVLIDNFQGKPGEKITINVHPENSEYHFTASGVVVRVLPGNSGFSFRFQGMTDDAKRSIEKYLQEN